MASHDKQPHHPEISRLCAIRSTFPVLLDVRFSNLFYPLQCQFTKMQPGLIWCHGAINVHVQECHARPSSRSHYSFSVQPRNAAWVRIRSRKPTKTKRNDWKSETRLACLKLLMDLVLAFKQIINQVCRLSVEKYRQYNIENIIKQSKTKKKNV